MSKCFPDKTITKYKSRLDKLREKVVEGKFVSNDLVQELICKLTEHAASIPKNPLRRGPKTLNEKPLSEYVHSVLLRAQRPLTIKEVLDRVKKMGWIGSQLTQYQGVACALHNNIGVFVNRVERGRYSIRRR